MQSKGKPTSEISSLVTFAERLSRHPRLIIADDFELAIQKTRTKSAQHLDGVLGPVSERNRVWASLRLMHRRQPGRAVVSSLSEESIKELVDLAFDSSRRSTPDPWFRFPIWRSVANRIGPRTPSAEDLACCSVDPSPSLHVEEKYETSTVQTLLRRKGEKFTLTDYRSGLSSSLAVRSAGADDWFRIDEFRASSDFAGVDKEGWLRDLHRRAQERLQARPLRDGEHRGACVFAPSVAAVVVGALGKYLISDSVYRAEPLLATRVGENLISPELSIFDDGRLPGGIDSCPFDLEGTHTQKTPIFERGTLKTLLFDYYGATRENRLSTGNFLRSGNALFPRVQTSQLYAAPSKRSRSDLIGSVSKGLWLENVEAIECLDPVGGAYRLIASGWRLDRGQCVEPVKEIRLDFNILELLRSAASVADDLEHFGPYGSPSILFEDIPLR